MKTALFAFFFLGQVADFLTTFRIKERFPNKIREQNVFFAADVAQRKWKKILFWRAIFNILILGTLGSFIALGNQRKRKKKKKILAIVLFTMGMSSWAAAVWNTALYRHILKKETMGL